MKKLFMYRKSGFTLIELLIVIAIIGILSSVVLAALGASRDKARDSKVQASLSGLRNQAELYASDHNNGYDSFFVTGAWDSTTPKVKDILDSIAAEDVGGLMFANSAQDYWVAAAQLPSTVGTTSAFWCADNAGNARQWTGATDPDATITTCQ